MVAGNLARVIRKLRAEIRAQESWLRIQRIDSSACFHSLQALEGVIRGIKKKDLPAAIKEELKVFYSDHKLL